MFCHSHIDSFHFSISSGLTVSLELILDTLDGALLVMYFVCK